MDWKGLWKRLVIWVRIQLRVYEKEIKAFVNDMIDRAFQNFTREQIDKINPSIRKKVANKILADIIIKKIDTTTISGKSEVARLTLEAIDQFTKEE